MRQAMVFRYLLSFVLPEEDALHLAGVIVYIKQEDGALLNIIST